MTVSESSAPEKVFRVSVQMTVEYEVNVKARDAEQADEFICEKFKYGNQPDEDYFIDATLESTYVDEDPMAHPGDEDFDATEEPLPPKKKKALKKSKVSKKTKGKKRRSS